MIRALAVAGVTCAAAVASADGSGELPVVSEAASANLAPVGRHGVQLGAALQPATILGFGSRNDVGVGAEVVFRLGKMASSSTEMYVELQGGGILHKPASGSTATNSFGALTLGAMYYVAPSLWLGLGLGWGTYMRRSELIDGNPTPTNESLSGPVGEVGFGIELVRWKLAALGLEASTALLTQRHGVTTMSGFGLDLTF